ncbi:MAG: hypothetical protein IPI45_03685 [Saprospiraceae bacterium]|nr:hypothetical protein [Saprospiraceae bacterium]
MKNILLILHLLALSSIEITAQDSISLQQDSFQISLLEPDNLETEIESDISGHRYQEAVSSILNAIEYYKQENNLEKVYYYRFLLARIYQILGFFQKAINSLEYCHVYFKQEGRDLDVVRSQHALAYAYKKMGNTDMAFYF